MFGPVHDAILRVTSLNDKGFTVPEIHEHLDYYSLNTIQAEVSYLFHKGLLEETPSVGTRRRWRKKEQGRWK